MYSHYIFILFQENLQGHKLKAVSMVIIDVEIHQFNVCFGDDDLTTDLS